MSRNTPSTHNPLALVAVGCFGIFLLALSVACCIAISLPQNKKETSATITNPSTLVEDLSNSTPSPAPLVKEDIDDDADAAADSAPAEGSIAKLPELPMAFGPEVPLKPFDINAWRGAIVNSPTTLGPCASSVVGWVEVPTWEDGSQSWVCDRYEPHPFFKYGQIEVVTDPHSRINMVILRSIKKTKNIRKFLNEITHKECKNKNIDGLKIIKCHDFEVTSFDIGHGERIYVKYSEYAEKQMDIMLKGSRMQVDTSLIYAPSKRLYGSKFCRKGCPCGKSCISCDLICHKKQKL